MAFVVRHRSGGWELRESRSTEAGPRSRTLASFRTLTPEVVERARERAGGALTATEIRRAALRAGAPIARSGPDRAAVDLLSQLAAGRRPSVAIQRLIADALPRAQRGPSDAERAVAPWIGAGLDQRGEALRDLLLLADALPVPGRETTSRFPRIHSSSR